MSSNERTISSIPIFPSSLLQIRRFLGCVDCAVNPAKISDHIPAFTLVSTIGIPLFTHGVGGLLFHRKYWSFQHAFNGGQLHIITQALGWSFVAIGAILQEFNLYLHTSVDPNLLLKDELMYVGNLMGWIR